MQRNAEAHADFVAKTRADDYGDVADPHKWHGIRRLHIDAEAPFVAEEAIFGRGVEGLEKDAPTPRGHPGKFSGCDRRVRPVVRDGARSRSRPRTTLPGLRVFRRLLAPLRSHRLLARFQWRRLVRASGAQAEGGRCRPSAAVSSKRKNGFCSGRAFQFPPATGKKTSRGSGRRFLTGDRKQNCRRSFAPARGEPTADGRVAGQAENSYPLCENAGHSYQKSSPRKTNRRAAGQHLGRDVVLHQN